MKVATQRVHTAARLMNGAAADSALSLSVSLSLAPPALLSRCNAHAPPPMLAPSQTFRQRTQVSTSKPFSAQHAPSSKFCTQQNSTTSRRPSTSLAQRTSKLAASTCMNLGPAAAARSFTSLSASTMSSASSSPIIARLLEPDASPAEEEADMEEADTNSEADQDLPNHLPQNDIHQQRTHAVGSEEQMLMQVPTTADILRTKQKFGNALHSVYENDTVQVATEMMNLFGIGAVAVKNQREQIIGVMSSRDYMLAVGCGHAHPKSSLVKEMMRHRASCVYDDESLVTALYEMVVAPTKSRWIIVRRRPRASRTMSDGATASTSTSGPTSSAAASSSAASLSSASSSELVLNSDEVLGLLSVSDVLKFLAGNLHETSSHLRHFIQNTYSFAATNTPVASPVPPTSVTSSTNGLFERFRPARQL